MKGKTMTPRKEEVCEAVAQIKGISIDDVMSDTTIDEAEGLRLLFKLHQIGPIQGVGATPLCELLPSLFR